VGDAGLVNFKGCKSLTHVYLSGSQLGDVGLTIFKDCKNLMLLHVGYTHVTDLGLAQFKGYKGFTRLWLGGTQLTDAGLAVFKDCKYLRFINLDSTKISDEGLKNLAGQKVLEGLSLKKTNVTAAGIDDLKKSMPWCKIEWDHDMVMPTAPADPDRKAAEWVLLTGGRVWINQQEIKAAAELPDELCRLTGVDLHQNFQVGDADLTLLKDCKNLTTVNLSGTLVTDTGLALFKDSHRLTVLNLQQTRVTAAKVEELRKALPKCKIGWEEK
jgi:hypothetical protein